ncbi:hypothetical protein [Desulfobulbus sp.]|uniref:hypothetical protein n=1 Tax=Desulfobulbus sp. TaxID=895 RepID=UPI0027B907AC|nr:hypothetical protein [Desulfobulbus sp.]
MNAIQQPEKPTVLSASEQRDVEAAANRIREIGISVATLGKIMSAIQLQLILEEEPSAPCGDCQMHEIVKTPTLFALQTAIKELGGIVHTLGDNIETTIHHAHQRKGSA